MATYVLKNSRFAIKRVSLIKSSAVTRVIPCLIRMLSHSSSKTNEESYRYKKIYCGPARAVIFDWAGTVVDCGVLAPVYTFVRLFEDEGIHITEEEARGPMGSHKRVHIQKILGMTDVLHRWLDKKGNPPSEADVEKMYQRFVPTIMTCLSKHSALISGVLETVSKLKNMGLKIGSTTGYPSEVLRALLETSRAQGFDPQASVAADQVPEARPCPYMVWSCAMQLGAHPVQSLVKVDDTVDGIGEGISAGCWTVGVAQTSNYVGWTEEQLLKAKPDVLRQKVQAAYGTLASAGAHYIVDSVKDVPLVLEDINRRLAMGDQP